MSNRSRIAVAVLAGFAGALIAALLIFDGDGVDGCDGACTTERVSTPTVATNPATTTPEPKAGTPAERKAERTERKASGTKAGKQATEEGPSGPAPTSDPQKQAGAAVNAFLRDLDRRDATAICRAFDPGALNKVDFPKPGPNCPSTVEASLGYRDPRGLPVWKGSKPTGDISAQIDGDRARVTATVVTDYKDQRDPSVEDDVLYLQRIGERWILLKPSATFYRAIGVADVPLDAFKPPE
ncbi:hypothetical protein BH10ACT11_BH10ACT11_01520 [soil metagenome]